MKSEPIFKQENSIPHFRPSFEEFADFKQFIQHIQPFGQQCGLVKITPPKEWASIVTPHASKNAPRIKIRSAIMQEFEGKLGIYRLKNKEVRKTFSVNDWFELCNSANYNGPQCVSENGTFKLISQSDKNQKIQDYNSGEKRKRRAGIEPLMFDLSVTGQGYPEFWLLKAEEFYWKNVLNHSPIYAGDLLGTLMDYDKRNEWNIGALDNILTKMDGNIIFKLIISASSRSKCSIFIFWNVESIFSLAFRRYGLVFNQLFTFWCTQAVVCDSTRPKRVI